MAGSAWSCQVWRISRRGILFVEKDLRDLRGLDERHATEHAEDRVAPSRPFAGILEIDEVCVLATSPRGGRAVKGGDMAFMETTYE